MINLSQAQQRDDDSASMELLLQTVWLQHVSKASTDIIDCIAALALATLELFNHVHWHYWVLTTLEFWYNNLGYNSKNLEMLHCSQ